MTAPDASVRAAAGSVRELVAAEAPQGLDVAELTAWYAGQLGALRWHAGTLADAIDPAGTDLDDAARRRCFDSVVGQALRDATVFQREHRGAGWHDQMGLYAAAARAFGVDLGYAVTAPVGALR